MRIIAASIVALMAASPLPAVAQSDEIIRLGIGIFGSVIQDQMQKPRPSSQPVQTSRPAPRAAAVPAPKIAPVPAPYPAFRMADAKQIETAPADGIPAMIYFDHNRSSMALTVKDGLVRIVYDRPRDGLSQAGVSPGTVLFQGAVIDGTLHGDAFAFKQGCDPAPYPVTGTYDANGIVLNGPGPVRSGCAVTRLDPASPHSSLVFVGDATQLPAMLPQEIKIEPVIADIPAVLPEIVPVAEPTPAVGAVEQIPEQQVPVVRAPIMTPPAIVEAPVQPVEVAAPISSPLPAPSIPAAAQPVQPTPKPVPAVEPKKPSVTFDL